MMRYVLSYQKIFVVMNENRKSKLTLIVDGNWLLMSRMSIMQGKYPNEEAMMKDVKILMMKSINIVLRQFIYIDNIIFVADHGSWRQKQSIPEFLITEGIEYKGNRTKSEDINWDVIFKEYDNFLDLLRAKGVQVSHEYDIEGDDWCWYWSNRLNKEQTNCIIWSRDRDLTQLVKRDDDGVFTVIWSKEAGLVMKDESESLTSFLINPYYAVNDNILSDIVQKSAKKSQILPEQIVIDKIIRGDAGDNIIPIILRCAKKSGSSKMYKVSSKDLPNSLDIYNENEIGLYIDSILEHKSYKDRVNKTRDNIIEHFKYNRSLVVLDESSYPDYIKEVFNEYNEKDIQKVKSETLKDVETELIAQKNQINSILDEI